MKINGHKMLFGIILRISNITQIYASDIHFIKFASLLYINCLEIVCEEHNLKRHFHLLMTLDSFIPIIFYLRSIGVNDLHRCCQCYV